MTRFDATHQQEQVARQNLINTLRRLEEAVADQIVHLADGHSPDMRQVNRKWLAIEEATVIHRACLQAVDESVMWEAS